MLDPKYYISEFQNASPDAREALLAQLENELTQRLRPIIDFTAYEEEVSRIVAELKILQHDLWHHDYDGQQQHTWGHNYMQPETDGSLYIEFKYPGSVKLSWHQNNG